MHVHPHYLKLKRLGIDTHQEAIVYMRSDCHICRSEGFDAQSRVQVTTPQRSIIATLNIIYDGLLEPQEAGLSEAAWKLLAPYEGEKACFSHPPTVDSLSHIRSKLYGHPLSQEAMSSIIRDVVDGKYTDVQLAAFIASCVGNRLGLDEIIALTRAMIGVGRKLDWNKTPVVDKHSIGGLPGNRTTPIVVSLVAAAGLTMPKTSSKAITSPAGTADTLSTLTHVELDLPTMRQVVDQEGGCFVWGGAMHLSPADEILIRIERTLDLDGEGQLVASILSKKAAAGSTHVLIDMPVGPTAKVRDLETAHLLKHVLEKTGEAIGLQVQTWITPGDRPVGRGIGPALEARDVLAVLQQDPTAPADLREKSLSITAKIIAMALGREEAEALHGARQILTSGLAWKKFQAICEAQGGLHLPARAPFTHEILAPQSGVVKTIDNRHLAMAAKLAGAPEAKTAGVCMHVDLGQRVEQGEALLTLHAETRGELNYALSFVAGPSHPILIFEEA